MFEENLEYSSDIEWILQNGEAGDEEILSILVHEYYDRINEIAASILLDTDAALKATQAAFASAILQRHRYTSDLDARVWVELSLVQVLNRRTFQAYPRPFYSQVPTRTATGQVGSGIPLPVEMETRLWSSLGSMDEKFRLPLLLNWIHGIAQEEIAQLLETNVAAVSARIERARRQLISEIPAEYPFEWIHDERQLSGHLAQSFRAWYSANSISPPNAASVVSEIKTILDQERQEKRRRTVIQELLLVCIALVLVFTLVKFVDNFSAEANLPQPPPIQLEKQPINPPVRERLASSPKTQTSTSPVAESLQEPLTQNSSHGDILRRLLLGKQLWETLWVDLKIVFYGPEGYIGPPQGEHHQVWIDRNHRVLVISGSLEGNPKTVELMQGDDSAPTELGFMRGIEDYARLGSQVPWVYLSAEKYLSSPYLTHFSSLLSNRSFNGFTFKALNRQSYAGQEAVIVDMVNQAGEREARLWLDAITGLVLRQQYFGNLDRFTKVLEVFVTDVTYDGDFPPELFELWKNSTLRASFVRDYAGQSNRESRPVPLSSRWKPILYRHLKAPADFEVAESRITFQKAGVLDDLSGLVEHEIFANNYFLGSIELTDAFRTICQRSPNGKLIAFTEIPSRSQEQENVLRWMVLSDLTVREFSSPGLVINHFAFSPNSRLLAVSHTSRSSKSESISILDTDSGEHIKLGELPEVLGLAWSPEGDQLAVLQDTWFLDPGFIEGEVRLFDLKTGEASSHSEMGTGVYGEFHRRVPLSGWTADFSLHTQGLEACAAPPDNR